MRSWLIALVVAACGGGSAPPNVDAHPLGPLCSKKLYDLCTEEHDCDSGRCLDFGNSPLCTQSCVDGGEPCPADKSGAPAVCENAFCKPSAPNMCHLPGQ